MFSFKNDTGGQKQQKRDTSLDMTAKESQKYYINLESLVFHEVIGYNGWCHCCKKTWTRTGKKGWVNSCPHCGSKKFGQEGYSE